MNSTSFEDMPAPESAPHSMVGPLIISGVAVIALFALSGWAWLQLPADARIPIHWNAEGQANGYGGRGMLFLMPGTMLVLSLMFAVLPRIEPRREQLLQSFKAYRAVWLAVLGLLGGTHVLMVQAALGKPVAMDRFLFIGLGVLMVVIGNFLGKVRSNYVFGVRTPWTLSSELSWNKTHRLAGRLFVSYGLAMIIATLVQLPGKYIVGIEVGSVVVLLIILFAYSYVVWKRDPNKVNVGSSRK